MQNTDIFEHAASMYIESKCKEMAECVDDGVSNALHTDLTAFNTVNACILQSEVKKV